MTCSKNSQRIKEILRVNFVHSCASIAAPLIDLLKKDSFVGDSKA